MSFLIIQSALLMMIAYVLGCIIGALLKSWLSTPEAAPIEKVESKPEAVTKPAVSEKPAEAETVALVDDTSKKDKPKKKAKNKKEKTKKKAKAKAKVKADAKAVAKPKAAVRGKNDDLKLIKGIGIQNEAKLNALKVTSFAQIAEWKAKDIKEIGDRLEFGGRIINEKWVSQAKTLAAGKQTEFSKRVRKGEVQTSLSKGKK